MATPITGRPNGRHPPPFDRDTDRYAVGLALALDEAELFKSKKSTKGGLGSFQLAALLATPGKHKRERNADAVKFSVHNLSFPGASTIRVRTRRLQRKWAVWHKEPECRRRIEAIKKIILLQLLPYDGTEEDRQYEMWCIGDAVSEERFALIEILKRSGFFDVEFAAYQEALEAKLARGR